MVFSTTRLLKVLYRSIVLKQIKQNIVFSRTNVLLAIVHRALSRGAGIPTELALTKWGLKSD